MPRIVHNNHSSVNEVENVSRRQLSATENFNAPTAKTKKIAISVSREDARQTLSHVDRVNACLNMSSAMQSFHVAMEAMSRRTCADPKSSSQIHSKDHRASQQHVGTVTVHSNAATDDAEVQRLCAVDVTVAATEVMSSIVQSVVSEIIFSQKRESRHFLSFFVRLSRSISHFTNRPTAAIVTAQPKEPNRLVSIPQKLKLKGLNVSTS